MRHEFTAAAIREADARANGRCEATGERYGLPAGVRCNADLTVMGRQRDHFPRGAHDPHPDTSTAGNCVVCCPAHNQFANNKIDTPREARMKGTSYDHALHTARMQRKAGADVADPVKPRGRQAKKPPPMRSRGFQQGHRPIPKRPFPQRQR